MRPFKYHNRNFSPNASRPDKDLKLRDARQLDLFEYILDAKKREAFAALDEAIAVTLKKDGR